MSTNEFEGKYNLKSPGVKRLMREACELKEITEEYSAHPLEDNLFEWHFTIRGPPDTEFEGGIYHGRIILPSEYPMKPPNIILLTPNGRFETNTKICLSISGHHPETWQPSWSIRTALLALIAFMPTPGSGTAGSLDYTPEERKTLARKSKQWSCSLCGKPTLKDHVETATGHNATVPERKEEVLEECPEEETPAEEYFPNETPRDSPVTLSSGLASSVCIGVLIVAIIAIILRRIFLM
ncbi:ubiquitin-conjugating enzyme E2 J1 [Diaphorina citri]|uniref:Ubiquitin-conjugating enzyme E2 J1 n=1 Tax=Diaphorina citri TaxID=121845 RepID=A0A1S3DCN0_DIACI|nr:ubiquitin-conjugating enzyme E2 J1 [Diaphorina citri]KAI5753665.1 hypothetical protein M8J77_002282 [Diaphorina citri]